MKEVTNLMIREFHLEKLGYDFMGYSLNKGDIYTFHHLIIPKKACKDRKIEKDGFVKWNGAILCRDTSHKYLHLIETTERKVFKDITSIMIEMNKNGELDIDNLRKIDKILLEFEERHKTDITKGKQKLLKIEFLKRNHF